MSQFPVNGVPARMPMSPQATFPQQAQPQMPQQFQQPTQPQQWQQTQVPPMSISNPFMGNHGGGMFTGIGQAKIANGVDYVRIGRYWGRINVCKTDFRAKDGLPFAAVDMTIVNVMDNDNGRGHRPNDNVSFFTKRGMYFLSDVKGFIAGVLGESDIDKINEETASAVFGPGQPFRNITVEFEAKERSTKQGGIFTKVTFRREVPPAEVLQTLQAVAPTMVQVWYPDGILERMCAAYAQNGVNPAPQQVQQPQAAPAQFVPPQPPQPTWPQQPQQSAWPQQPQFASPQPNQQVPFPQFNLR